MKAEGDSDGGCHSDPEENDAEEQSHDELMNADHWTDYEDQSEEIKVNQSEDEKISS